MYSVAPSLVHSLCSNDRASFSRFVFGCVSAPRLRRAPNSLYLCAVQTAVRQNDAPQMQQSSIVSG
jgi:hypothetical protein